MAPAYLQARRTNTCHDFFTTLPLPSASVLRSLVGAAGGDAQRSASASPCFCAPRSSLMAENELPSGRPSVLMPASPRRRVSPSCLTALFAHFPPLCSTTGRAFLATAPPVFNMPLCSGICRCFMFVDSRVWPLSQADAAPTVWLPMGPYGTRCVESAILFGCGH